MTSQGGEGRRRMRDGDGADLGPAAVRPPRPAFVGPASSGSRGRIPLPSPPETPIKPALPGD